MTKKLLITLSILTLFASCGKATETEKIWVVVQPIAEVGKTLDFSVIFSSKAEISFAEIDIIDGLTLNSNYIFERGEDFHWLYTDAVPQRLGKIEIPSFSITIDGVEHQSRPFYINVVENITIDENSVRTILVLDREVYRLQDTIRMSLFQYSKFSRTEAQVIPNDITSIESTEEGVLHLPRVTFSIRELIGIANIEEFPNTVLGRYRFKIHRFPFSDFGRHNRRMATLDGETYIKTELVRFYFIANQKGTFRFEPSMFDFTIERSREDFTDRLTINEYGGLTVSPPQHNNILRVVSNPIEIVVR